MYAANYDQADVHLEDKHGVARILAAIERDIK